MKNNKNNLNEDLKRNALRSNSFGGKRFLGLTKNGGEVWVSYFLSRDTYDLNISLTHNLSSLLEDGAVLAERRVSLKKGSTQRYTAQEMVRKNQKRVMVLKLLLDGRIRNYLIFSGICSLFQIMSLIEIS